MTSSSPAPPDPSQDKLIRQAVKGDGDCWEFTPQAQGSQIQAEAWDLAGHKATYRSD